MYSFNVLSSYSNPLHQEGKSDRAQTIMRPPDTVPPNLLTHNSQVVAASPTNDKNRERHNSHAYQHSRSDDGAFSVQSTKEGASIFDKYGGPSLGSSTGFTDLSRGSPFQEHMKGFTWRGSQAISAAAINESLDQMSSWPQPLAVSNRSGDVLMDIPTSLDFSQFNGSHEIDDVLWKRDSSNPYLPQLEELHESDIFQFSDPDSTPKPSDLSIPGNVHHPDAHEKFSAGHRYGAMSPTRQPVTSSTSQKTAQRSTIGAKRPRLTKNDSEAETHNAPLDGSPTPAIADLNEQLQPHMQAMLYLWRGANPNRLPNKSELKSLKIVVRASPNAILRFFKYNGSSAIDTSAYCTNQLPTKVTVQPDPQNTCQVKKRTSLAWNNARDPEKMYSCTRKCGSTFRKKGDWIRHEQINCPQYSWHCSLPKCSSSFNRKDKLRDHIKVVHELNPEDSDLDSARTSLAHQLKKRCGFCGLLCTSWQAWTDHVGNHFEGHVEGGPWEMSRWRDPWVDEQADQSTGDDGDDSGDDEDSDCYDDQDAPHDSTDDFSGSFDEPRGPTRRSRSSRGQGRGEAPSRSGAAGKSGSKYQAGQHISVPFRTTKVAQTTPRIESTSRTIRHRPNEQPQEALGGGRVVNATTRRLARNGSDSIESVNLLLSADPIADLACTGKSRREGHNAVLAPYLEDQAQVLTLSQAASDSSVDSQADFSRPRRAEHPASSANGAIGFRRRGPRSQDEDAPLWINGIQKWVFRSLMRCRERYHQHLKHSPDDVSPGLAGLDSHRRTGHKEEEIPTIPSADSPYRDASNKSDQCLNLKPNLMCDSSQSGTRSRSKASSSEASKKTCVGSVVEFAFGSEPGSYSATSRPHIPPPSTHLAEKHIVDIVVVHGLNVSAFDKWTSSNSTCSWSSKLLPKPFDRINSRLLAYGYDTEVAHTSSGLTTQDYDIVIRRRATRLLDDRAQQRESCYKCSIFFVCDAGGETIVEEAIQQSMGDIIGSSIQDIFDSWGGVVRDESLDAYQHRHKAAKSSNSRSTFLWPPTCSYPKSDPEVCEPASASGLAAANLQTLASSDEHEPNGEFQQAQQSDQPRQEPKNDQRLSQLMVTKVVNSTTSGTHMSERMRILSLDGAGVTGLFSLVILKFFMKALQPSDGPSGLLPIDTIFDFIGGTSTGGLLTLMPARCNASLLSSLSYADRSLGRIDAFIDISRLIQIDSPTRISVWEAAWGPSVASTLSSALTQHDHSHMLKFGEMDLEVFFGNRLPPVLHTEVEDFWKALSEVVDAVADIHDGKTDTGGVFEEFEGCHADIKPENIISVRGSFKLADLGFYKFVKKGESDQKTFLHGGTEAYGPPECYRQSDKSKRTPIPFHRTIDIWSLGCVLSIAATWVVFGWPGVGQFRTLRETAIKKIIDEQQSQHPSGQPRSDIAPNDAFHDGHKVLNDVTLWHKVLRESLRKTDTITERVLDLVDRQMLQSNPKDRIKAASLCKQLDQIFATQNQGHRQLVPGSIMHTLLDVDNSAPANVAKSILARAAPQQEHSTSGGFLDREAHKSFLLSLPPMKTSHRSEYLGNALATRSPRAETSGVIHKSPTEDTDDLESCSLPRMAGSKRARTTSAEKAAASSPPMRFHSFPDTVPTRTLTNQTTMTTAQWNASQPKPKNNMKIQNVFQARDELDRRPKRLSDSLPVSRKKKEKRKKDDVLSQNPVTRDFVFLIDNAETMESYWREATELLTALVRKAQYQDDNGMDLFFTLGSGNVKGSNDPAVFEKEMKDPINRPKRYGHTDINMKLGNILNEYLTELKRVYKPQKNLTLIVLTDGIWEGTLNKRDVEEKIVKFVKKLMESKGELQERPVSIQFVRFGDNPNAISRLRRLDNDLKYRGIPDIIDTEPSLGNVDKMLLSFITEYDDDDHSDRPGTADPQSPGPPQFPETPDSINGEPYIPEYQPLSPEPTPTKTTARTQGQYRPAESQEFTEDGTRSMPHLVEEPNPPVRRRHTAHYNRRPR